ncbi:MAG: hypothetical protein K2M81_02425, partial [Lachnospiraceae bacterium]|nr:hypothetical protein [Lachnospiraceae bacterium]
LVGSDMCIRERCQGLREWMEDERNAGLEVGKAEMLVSSVESVMLKFNVDLGKACEGVGTTVEEYFKAKGKAD